MRDLYSAVRRAVQRGAGRDLLRRRRGPDRRGLRPDRAGGGRGGQVKRFLISADWVGCSGLQGQDFYCSAYFRSFPPILAIPGVVALSRPSRWWPRRTSQALLDLCGLGRLLWFSKARFLFFRLFPLISADSCDSGVVAWPRPSRWWPRRTNQAPLDLCELGRLLWFSKARFLFFRLFPLISADSCDFGVVA